MEVPSFDQSRNPEPQEKPWILGVHVEMKMFGTQEHVEHAVEEVQRWLAVQLKDQLIRVHLAWQHQGEFEDSGLSPSVSASVTLDIQDGEMGLSSDG